MKDEGYLPKAFITQLLEAIDLVEIITRFIPLQKKSTDNYFALCPFHHEKSPSFSVSKLKQFYYCFGCHESGNAIDFMMKHAHLGFVEAVHELAHQAGLTIPKATQVNQSSSTTVDNVALYQLNKEVAAYYQKQLSYSQPAQQYLQHRGISEALIKQFCIGYAPGDWQHLLAIFGKTSERRSELLTAGLIIQKSAGHYYCRFRDRLMFPIYNQRGHIVGFGGRVFVKDQTPKYLNSPETVIFHKGRELYGLSHLLTQQHQPIPCLLVEGYLDVIALFQYGFSSAVATLGTATTPHHIKQLSRYASEIVFCFDGDQAGRTAAWRALQVIFPLMDDRLQIRFLFLPEGEDPDTLIRKEGKIAFEKRILQAIPLSTFFFDLLAQKNNLYDIEGRSHFAAQGLTYIKQLPASLFKTMLLEELSVRSRVGLATLQTRLHRQIKSKQTIGKPGVAKLVRLMIACLFQQPQLAQTLQSPLPPLTIPGYALLVELVAIIQKNNLTDTSILKEYYRHHPAYEVINDCLCASYHFTLEHIESEFRGGELQLIKLWYDIEINHLLHKASLETLSMEEKKKLVIFIRKKKFLIES